MALVCHRHLRVVAGATEVALIRADVDHRGHDEGLGQVEADERALVRRREAVGAVCADNLDRIRLIWHGADEEERLVEGDKILRSATICCER